MATSSFLPFSLPGFPAGPGKGFLDNKPGLQLLLSVLSGFMLPVIIYAVLPLLGIRQLADFFSEDKIRLLFLLVGSSVYGYYLEFMVKRPSLLLYQALICSPLVVYGSRTMPGVISETLIVVAYMIIPTAILYKNNFKVLHQKVPYLKFFTIHMAIVLLYFTFYQKDFYDYTRPGAMGLLPVGFKYLYDQLCMYFITILAGNAFICSQDKKKLLTTTSWIVSINLLYMTVIGIATCLLGMKEFYMQDHLIRRAQSLLAHPNEFAEYLSICLFFVLSLFCFRLSNPDFKLKKAEMTVQISAIIIALIGLIMTFSKTILASAFVGLTVFAVLVIFAFRKQLAKYFVYALAVPVVMVFSLFTFQAVTQQDVLSSLGDRLGQNESMEWRVRVNDFLTNDLTLESIWFGYGLSASNEKMSTFEVPWIDKVNHDNKIVQVVKVHNAFLKQIYDCGLPGLTIFLGLIVFAFQKLVAYVKSTSKSNICILDIMCVSFVLFYLIACSNETIFENGGYVPPFWCLLTLLHLTSLHFQQVNLQMVKSKVLSLAPQASRDLT